MPNWRPTDYLDRKGNPSIHIAGNHGYVSKFDDKNREIERTWLDTDGKPVELNDKIARWSSEYDERGREISRRFFDASLKPALGTGGFRRKACTLDDAGNETSRSFFDVEDKPVGIECGMHCWVAKYDEKML